MKRVSFLFLVFVLFTVLLTFSNTKTIAQVNTSGCGSLSALSFSDYGTYSYSPGRHWYYFNGSPQIGIFYNYNNNGQGRWEIWNVSSGYLYYYSYDTPDLVPIYNWTTGPYGNYPLPTISGPSTTTNNCTAPGAPSWASGTPTGKTTATINWGSCSPGPPTNYYWVVGTSSSVGWGSGVAQSTTAFNVTTASVTGLTANTTYYLRVYGQGCSQGGYTTSGAFTTYTDPTITSFTPTTAYTGQSVVITGTNFAGISAVSFGGTAASSFVVNSSTQITAVVGAGTSGSVSVTNPASTGTKTGFTYTPSISLTATLGTTTGTYANLKAAFDAVNSGTHKGVINIMLNQNSYEPVSAVLNASGSGSSSYTSINIYPTITGLNISGSVAGPVIDLNGADNVTIDGRVNATGSAKDLIITNISTSSTAGTSTIRFINDALTNTIKYCILKGSTTDASGGVLFFSTTTGTTGNDGNTIYNNSITNSTDANRPLNAIYSAGTSAKTNSGNTISNNWIYNFLNQGTASNGIQLAAYNTGWTVSTNSFYETASFVPTAVVTYTAIYVSDISSADISISGNYIGGSAPTCGTTGSVTSWTKTNASTNTFYAINLNAGPTVSTVTSVQGNTISNFTWGDAGASSWTAVNIPSTSTGAINIGTVTANTIGANTGAGSITVTAAATGANVYGINIGGTGVVDCQNNTLGAITAGNASTLATNFYGINKTNTSGTTTIKSNTIGSTTTANSINASSGSTSNAQLVYAIYSAGTGTVSISGNTVSKLTNSTSNSTAATTGLINGIYVSAGTNTVANNTVRDLTIANANTTLTSTASAGGIVFNNTTAAAQIVSGNTIYNLSNSYTSFAGFVFGLYYAGPTIASTVSGNFIYSLTVTGASSTGANIYGICISSGATTYSNNIVTLGGSTSTVLIGIYETGAANNNNNLYFNTVYIGGTPATSPRSYALYSAVNTNTRNFRNNIFYNARSTANQVSNWNYAVFIANSGGTITCDYNDYYFSGTAGQLGFYGTYISTLPIVTSQDAHSLSTNPSFASAGGTTPGSYQAGASLTGVTATGITTDYFGRTRSIPKMGAIESGVYYIWTGTTNTDWSTTSNWVGGAVPSAGNENVIIQTGAANMPVTGTDITYNTLEVQSGTTMTLGSNISLSGTLSLSGLLVLGNNNLTLSSSSVISGTPSANNMIVATGTGEIRKTFTGTGSFTFPVGDNTGTTEYSPVTLNFTSGGFSSAYAGVKVSNTKHGSNISQTDYLNRYWTVSQSGITSFACDVTLQYVPADVVGTESNIWAGKYSSGVWTQLNQTNAGTHTLSGTAVTGFSDFTGGQENVLPVSLSSFTFSVNVRDVKLNWVTGSEMNNSGFEIERVGIRQLAPGNWEKIGYVSGKGTTNEQTTYNFEDKKLVAGKYQYRLKQIDNNGNFEYHNLNGDVEVGVPKKYEMSQNYPNPFNPMTKIDFQLPMDGKVMLVIYDITGREIARLLNNEFKKADYYTVMFNGSNLSSGVYFYRITADKYVMTKKMVLVK